MRDEISAAVLFLARLIEKSENFNQEKLQEFKDRLSELLQERFENHWFPDKPDKGQGYRCIRVNGVNRRDPTLEKAAIASGIKYEDMKLPFELTIWVDPNEVACRFGESKGSFCTLASFCDKESMDSSSGSEESSEDSLKGASPSPLSTPTKQSLQMVRDKPGLVRFTKGSRIGDTTLKIGNGNIGNSRGRRNYYHHHHQHGHHHNQPWYNLISPPWMGGGNTPHHTTNGGSNNNNSSSNNINNTSNNNINPSINTTTSNNVTTNSTVATTTSSSSSSTITQSGGGHNNNISSNNIANLNGHNNNAGLPPPFHYHNSLRTRWPSSAPANSPAAASAGPPHHHHNNHYHHYHHHRYDSSASQKSALKV